MNKINYKHRSTIHNPKDALTILPFILDVTKSKTIIDVGCGNGSWLNAAKKLGANEVFGVDGIEVAEEELLISKSEFLKYDLSTSLNLNKKYDLAISLEVAEHLPESSAVTFIQTLCNHSDVILFSAAIPNQGGDHHFNEQWPEYWEKLFKKNNYLAYDFIRPKIWNNKEIFWWYKQNTLLYIKKGHSIIDSLDNSQKRPLSMVHPELYSRKMDKPEHLTSNIELIRLIKKTLKILTKRYLGYGKS
ncbi:methyltransferase domain-containing protein [Winogradskyella maritima]|uniref:Class I SAM-dependent methyltransferase n=1 Tax=Winogradskyella maritima TaxID=1517766 RepID=A0ABV8AH59_9FLAO|nr:methyltransferase domain-containing protein [Winogradskyella maritima]